jgi:ornithine cyclodeaminase
MVDFIGISDIQRIVRQTGASAFIERLAGAIEADYARWDEFDKNARLAHPTPTGVIELMPITDGRLYAFKYVNGHPPNTQAGLLTVVAFGVLADARTGYPLLLSELTVTTALRTAAMSALAARWLARPDSRTMALLGCGAQAEFQAIAFHRLCGVRELRVTDSDPRAVAKLARNLGDAAELHDLAVIPVDSAAAACAGADIVTTATAARRRALVLTPAMVAPGMHLNAIGGDCPGKTELDPDILRLPQARVVVEYEPQSRLEGEIQQLPPDFPVVEFADIVRRRTGGRLAQSDITIFDSVGFALEDYSALCLLRDLARELGLSLRQVDLVPHLTDPRDLYGEILAERRQHVVS